MFHRLAVPSYFGGLPGGYDYINNALSGTPANADGAKASGVNIGSYFVALGDSGLSANVNRPIKALAENCDYLDDILHRDLAVPALRTDVTPGVPVSSIILTGPGIFLGAAGTPNTAAGLETIFQILDSNDREIVDTGTGTECKVTAISGGTVGSGGFSTGNVTLTVSPSIPSGTTYRVWYATRSNLSVLAVDVFTNITIRGAQEVPAELIGVGGASLVGAAAAAASFTGAPWSLTVGTVLSQLAQLLADVNAPYAVRTITSSQTLDNGATRDSLVYLEPSAAINFTLTAPANNKGRQVTFLSQKGMVSAVNTVTLVRAGSEKINNVAASYVLDAPHGRWVLYCDGTDWCTLNA